jgi:hypothetical protein
MNDVKRYIIGTNEVIVVRDKALCSENIIQEDRGIDIKTDTITDGYKQSVNDPSKKKLDIQAVLKGATW